MGNPSLKPSQLNWSLLLGSLGLLPALVHGFYVIPTYAWAMMAASSYLCLVQALHHGNCGDR